MRNVRSCFIAGHCEWFWRQQQQSMMMLRAFLHIVSARHFFACVLSYAVHAESQFSDDVNPIHKYPFCTTRDGGTGQVGRVLTRPKFGSTTHSRCKTRSCGQTFRLVCIEKSHARRGELVERNKTISIMMQLVVRNF